MPTFEIVALGLYFTFLFTLGYISSRKVKTANDFIIGSRSLNFWLTAMAAHASDMSSWLFLAYPGLLFAGGLIQGWAGVGLVVFMAINWHFIAPRLRRLSEEWQCSTLSSFFEKRFDDKSGTLRLLTTFFCIGFYTIYLSAGLVGLGLLTESLFHLPYVLGILFGALTVVGYVSLGGYLALAWLDLIQGLFLMCVIVAVPFFAIFHFDLGQTALTSIQNWSLPTFDQTSLITTLSLAFGWGLGYFGQPHILTKFMGINKPSEMWKSKWVGMGWMTISLLAATGIGLLGILIFPQGLENPEMLFVEIVKLISHPFIAGMVLCAIIASTINVMSSQILVLSSTFAEDLYKRCFQPEATSEQLLSISRRGILVVTLFAFLIAFFKISSIYHLVLYAWSGLGASFGPLVVASLWMPKATRSGAVAGVLVGGAIAALWPLFNEMFLGSLPIDSMVPGFFLGWLSIWGVSSFQTRFQTNALEDVPSQ